MSTGEATDGVRLHKIKRPGGVFWFDLRQVGQDRDGTWLRGAVGSPWGAPHDCGTLSVPVVVLLATNRPWVAWWVGDPADQRLEIDVCLPPEVTEAGWWYVDLELDPVLHERGGRVEIEDWDEYEEACHNGWMTSDDAKLARATAERCADVLRQGMEPWLWRGWRILRQQA
ncbi:DUF402 domain-containing protein [Micromonospora sp. KC721]|uniref:DUF402 domain-containing protein n=1 Tax=Micromonospora sp. KC721 TaxID=2530380 RepID=UPI001050F12E|nr:DUF402 domain-containing protein [Micromonospora sp. KC721]TDB82089.1 DUF402 domain-containing protein [Micromonospora sp. KC721]